MSNVVVYIRFAKFRNLAGQSLLWSGIARPKIGCFTVLCSFRLLSEPLRRTLSSKLESPGVNRVTVKPKDYDTREWSLFRDCSTIGDKKSDIKTHPPYQIVSFNLPWGSKSSQKLTATNRNVFSRAAIRLLLYYLVIKLQRSAEQTL